MSMNPINDVNLNRRSISGLVPEMPVTETYRNTWNSWRFQNLRNLSPNDTSFYTA